MDWLNRSGLLGICLAAGAFGHIVAAQAETTSAITLQARPDTCVALHRGQTCYQAIQLSWQLPELRGVCLYRANQEAAVQCWTGMDISSLSLRYASDSSERFMLRDSQTDVMLIEVLVTTSWLYRGGRRGASGWRLF